ncbi:MAG: phosphoribosylanthranilate isomerase [Candidatus Eremiobacteraeota bacterium]|nr:phosphoribosylanthranilate isomerase [Candidatus Eremiobacteraeota bacterium]
MTHALHTRVKICGCTSAADVALAVDAGADAVGVILAERSERRISLERFRDIAQSVPALTTLVAVFVDPPESLVDEALKAGAIPQFHGDEPADACEAFAAGPYLKAFHVSQRRAYDPDEFARFAQPFEHATWMFDTAGDDGRSGGTGRTFAWDLARKLARERRLVISGGLTPENVGDCVREVRPYAVDVRSGVETNGMKDPQKVRAFVRAVRDADAELA